MALPEIDWQWDSDSDSDDEEELVLIIDAMDDWRFDFREIHERCYPFETMSDEKFFESFRLRKQTLMNLLNAVCFHSNVIYALLQTSQKYFKNTTA